MDMSYRVISNDHLMRLDTRLDEADLAFRHKLVEVAINCSLGYDISLSIWGPRDLQKYLCILYCLQHQLLEAVAYD